MQTAKREHVLAGLVGAFLGSLIGVACIVAVGQLGYVASFCGVVLAVCAIKGYGLLGGAMTRKGAVIASILTIFMTYLGNRLDFAVSVARTLDMDIFSAFRALDSLLNTEYTVSRAYWGNLVLLYLFTLVGAVPTLFAAFRHAGRDSAPSEPTPQPAPEPAPEPPPAAPSEARRAFTGSLFPALLPFIGLFLGVLVFWLSLTPAVLNLLVGQAESPEALLRGYRTWYILLIGAAVVAVLLPAAGSVIAIKKADISLTLLGLVVVSVGFPLFLGVAMLGQEDVPGLLARSGEDLAQLESGQLEQTTVWLSPRTQQEGLPGPYAEGQPEPVTQYSATGASADPTWTPFYIPDCLGFAPDRQTLYNGNESISWNEENSQQYRLSYTTQFHLVVSVEPVGEEAYG